MEWNINSDKLFIYWLVNFTSSSCIRFNILLMAMATNRNSEVAKTIAYIKYIRNMRSDFYLLTKCLEGKAIGNPIWVKQLNSDVTSHKVTEIINVILGVHTNNNKLRTICLAGDITPEDGTVEYQSAVIVDQFKECGQLLKGWRKQTIEMYATDTELDDLITSIPQK